MSVIYTLAWYEDLRRMIDESEDFADQAPMERIAMALEVVGDDASPYVTESESLHYLLVLDRGKVDSLEPLPQRHPGNGLRFRFTAAASVWESIAAGLLDPITAGLHGSIRIRGDMRFLMKNAAAVKTLVDIYADRVDTEWPKGKPPYASGA